MRRDLTRLTLAKTAANTALRWIPPFLPTLEKAFASGKPNVVNIMINAQAQRKAQEFGWLTR